MKDKIQVELSLEEMNEIYYVLGIALMKKNLMFGKYDVIENVTDKLRDKIANHEE